MLLALLRPLSNTQLIADPPGTNDNAASAKDFIDGVYFCINNLLCSLH